MYLKSYLVLCFVCTASICSFSQSTPDANSKKDRIKMLMNMLPQGHLYGKIIDQQNKKPVSFASVTLIAIRGSSERQDTVIGGCFTEKNGDFSIDNIKVISPSMMMAMMGGARSTDSSTKATVEDTTSTHRISKAPSPKYKLKISISGYDDYEMPISFSSTTSDQVDVPTFKMSGDDNTEMANAQSMRSGMMSLFNNLDKDLGNISMNPKEVTTSSKAVTLDEVTVTTNKNQAELSIDKRSYNVANMPLAENGTAVDVMKNIPALNVDINGNVSLRNNSPQIYIDGQPTDLTLDMIPSEMIEKVEVISNPSAKYDAGAATGILNIITKKNDKVGYFGMVRLGIDRFGLPLGGGNVSIRKKKVNFNLVLFGMMRKMEISGGTQRISPNSILNQKENGSNMRFNMINVRPSFDFYITNRTTLTLGGGYSLRSFKQFSNQDIMQQNFANEVNVSNMFQNRNGNTKGIMNMPSANIGLVQLFPKEGEKLTATVRYNGGYVDRPTLLHQQQWNGLIAQGDPLSAYFQQTNSTNENQRVRMQIDYENPIRKNMELDAGFSGQYRYTSQNYNVYQANTQTDLIIPSNEVKSLRNIYKNTEQTYALYVNFKHQIQLPNADYFSYQVGLRGELFFYDAQVSDTSNSPLSYKNYYYKNPWDILFPSVFLSYKMPNSGQEFQFNYTRRVNRPFFMLTNPYINYLDSLNVTQGNPDLKPAFSNYFELNYNKDIVDNRGNKHNIFVALYANYTTGMITNYQYQMSAENPLIITSYVNAGTSVVSGLEITPQFQVFTWWTLKPSFNLYYSNINTPAQTILNGQTQASRSEQWSYYAKLSMDFSLPKEFSIQLIGDYYSRRLSSPGNSQSRGMFNLNVASSQGYIDPYWGFDIAIKKNFSKSKIAALKPFSITLNASDIAGTRYFRTFSNIAGGITQSSWRRMNPFYVSLNISFRFGKLDANQQKKKNTKDSDSGDDGGGMGM